MDSSSGTINRVERHPEKSRKFRSGGGSKGHSGGSRERKRKVNRTLKTIIWLAQLAAEAVLGFLIVKLGMLSTPMMVAAFVVMVLLLLATFLLFGIAKKHNHSKIKARHVLGFILALGTIGISAFGSSVLGQVIGTVTEVTRPMMPSSTVAVYVMAEDPATEIFGAKDYEFSFTKAYDQEHTLETIDSIETEVADKITTKEFEDVFTMVDSLLKGESQAIILNKAYASLLDDTEEFQGFTDKTKVIYEKSFVVQAQPAQEEKKEEEKPKVDVSEGAFTIYLSGSDTRSYYLTTSRSDVNIIAAVNPTTHEILLVNTPRDYYVPISIGGGAYDKLTHCGVYGIQCSKDTLENLYGIDIDYTAQINFTGMETLIDNIGGITVYSDTAFTAYDGTYIDYGENFLYGSQALAFARERYKLSGGDNDRGRNQMKVLSAVIQKMMNSSTLLENYSGILSSLGGMFVTDMSYDDIAKLVKMQMTEGAEWNINNYAVVGRGGSSKETYSMPGWNLYVMYQNENSTSKATYLINQVLAGEHLTQGDMF